jgi:hydrogenase maturation factor
LIASGCLLIMVESSDSEKVIRSLGKAGIPAAIIVEIAQKEQGVKIRSEQRLKDVPMFARDEIARILEKA